MSVISCEDVKRSERASLPARDPSAEENRSLMASGGRQLRWREVENNREGCIDVWSSDGESW